MTKKYKGKYRTDSHRKPNWDYSRNGLYFITLVTQNRECNLGEIVNGKMILSNFGEIVNTEWHQSFEIRDELLLNEYVIMPNHLHAIVELKNTGTGTDGTAVLDGTHGASVLDNTHGASVLDNTHGRASLPSNDPTDKPFIRKPKSISSFIAGFKSATNTKIDDYIDEHTLDIPKYNRNNHFFQPNYHDHIIRNIKSHRTIAAYIINNPLKWNDDTFYT